MHCTGYARTAQRVPGYTQGWEGLQLFAVAAQATRRQKVWLVCIVNARNQVVDAGSYRQGLVAERVVVVRGLAGKPVRYGWLGRGGA